jgi:type II secretory pathway pseudopilin PulG
VVIAIIAILAVLVIAMLSTAGIKGRNATAISDVAAGGTAIEAFRADDATDNQVISNVPNPTGTADTLTKGSSGSLSNIFTGLQRTTGTLSYAAKITSVPGSGYAFSYTVPDTPASGTNRTLVGQVAGLPLYKLCATIIPIGSTLPYYCITETGTSTASSDPSGPNIRLSEANVVLPYAPYDGSAVYDSIDGNIYIIGGYVSTGNSASGILKFNPGGQTVMQINQGSTNTPYTLPNTIAGGGTAVFDPNNNSGYGTVYYFASTGAIYAFDPHNPNNNLVQVASAPSGYAHNFATSFWDASTQTAFIIGGSGTGVNTIYQFFPTNNHAAAQTEVLAASCSHMLTTWDSAANTAYLLGGNCGNGFSMNAYSYTPGTNPILLPNASLPVGMSGISMAWDDTDHVGYILGGYGASGPNTAIMEFNATSGTTATEPATMSPAIGGNAVVYDPQTQTAYSIGGYTTTNAAGSTAINAIVQFDTADSGF